jgi:hypothetical protein
MLFHPFIHFEIARQRQSEVLARADWHRLTKEARTVTQDDRGRQVEGRALSEGRPPMRTARPQRANS